MQLLTGFNEATKTTGFYSATLNKAANPKMVLNGNFKASFIAKAKNANAVIYSTESFTQFPETRYSDLSFSKSVQLTHLGKQQENIRWGTAELISMGINWKELFTNLRILIRTRNIR